MYCIMTDKKLTDSEIVNPCYLCKHPNEKPNRRKHYKCNNEECEWLKCWARVKELEEEINRLQAENEKLVNSLAISKKETKRYATSYKTVQAENERVRNLLVRFMSALTKVQTIEDVENISLIPIMVEENNKIRAQIKAEAYKEFAEGLTDKAESMQVNAFFSKYVISQEDIDNLLKELVGEV